MSEQPHYYEELRVGKGEAPRPLDGEKFRTGWERVFGKPEQDDAVPEGCIIDPCRHCGSKKDAWFSRGEPMGYFCPDCGKEA